MAPQHLGWCALISSVGFGICVAGTEAAHAQGEPVLVYEKLLDLRFNPQRTDDAAPPPPAEIQAGKEEEPFYDRSVSLRALVGDAGGGSRVVHGQEAKQGAWPTAVHFSLVKEDGRAGTCGGTVIGRNWILTAAHCAFRKEEGGAKLVRAATVFAKSRLRFDPNSKLPYDGERLRVKRVVVHPEFGRSGLLNDVALLELENASTAERQKLTAQAGVPTFLRAGSTATVVGWGITAPVPIGVNPGSDPARFPLSKVLVQANLPIPSQQACGSFLNRPVHASEFCAGDGTGRPDTCNGDSGGPLFVQGHAGEVIQAGTVSWGPGCAQNSTYGVYATVGYFEQWIRKYVPDVQFAMPRETPPVLAEIAGNKPGGPPAPHGQVTIDYLVHDCNAPFGPYKAANRVKVGECLKFQITSGLGGHLGVFSKNAQGKVEQLFPNRFSGGAQQGAAPTKVRSGQVVTIPGPSDAVQFSVGEPLGRAEIFAVVVPDAIGLPKATQPYRGLMRTVEDIDGELAELARQINLTPTAPRALGTRQYEVVQ